MLEICEKLIIWTTEPDEHLQLLIELMSLTPPALAPEVGLALRELMDAAKRETHSMDAPYCVDRRLAIHRGYIGV